MKRLKIESILYGLAAACLLCLLTVDCAAWISVFKGSEPVRERGLPSEARELANLPSRLGYWVGPPYGGGEYHFEYRCQSTEEFNEALKIFSKIPSPKLELVIKDGPFHSTFLDDLRADWAFVVLTSEQWYEIHSNPRLRVLFQGKQWQKPAPPPTIEVYLGGGSIEWEKVKVPADVNVLDQRAKPLPDKDTRIEGRVFDMITGRLIQGVQLTLARLDAPSLQIAAGESSTDGSFEWAAVPEGYYRVRARCEGYAARAVEAPYLKKKSLVKLDIELVQESILSGVVVGTDGSPLSGVSVKATRTVAVNGQSYEDDDIKSATTDAQGRFEIRSLPKGTVQLFCEVPSLHQNWLRIYPVPFEGIRITLDSTSVTGAIRGKVVRKAKEVGEPQYSHVVVYSLDDPLNGWTRTANWRPDGAFQFEGMPPGYYLVSFSNNMDGYRSAPYAKEVCVKSGETAELEIENP